MSIEGTPLPAGTEFFQTEDGHVYTVIDGEAYYQADDDAFYPESAFEPETDEPASANDEVPAWAAPLLERHAREVEDEVRADERGRIEAELEEEESPFVEWLRARPHLLADFENFEKFVDATPYGDLERAEQLWHASEDKLASARAHEGIGTPRNYDEATDEWFAERRAAVEPLKQDAPRRGDALGEAMNSFAEELHASNSVDRAARDLVRDQERRGR
jgi:hypothetical protein